MNTKKIIVALCMSVVLTACGTDETSTSESTIEIPASVSTSEVSTSKSTTEISTSIPTSDPTSSIPTSSTTSEIPTSITSKPTTSVPTGLSTSEKEAPYEPYENDDVKVTFTPTISTDKKTYELSFKYSDKYFEEDAKKYNQDLAELSLASSIATAFKARGTKFFTDCGFEDIEAVSYDTKPTLDTAGYFLAHTRIEDYELFVIAFRGFEYGQEWGNNLLIGKSGDHQGLTIRTNEAYTKLQTYIEEHSQKRALKLWINGYSRAGGLSNILSSLILRENKVDVSQENMYTYTFEAPRALSKEHALPYENVHNIVNKADLITYIAPQQYDLHRCGVDHEIFDSNVSTLAKAFDEGMNIPEYEETTIDLSEKTTLHNEREMIETIISFATNRTSSDETSLINTREQYVDNLQSSIVNVIGMVFALSDETKNELIADIKTKAEDTWSLLLIISSGESILEYLAPYLEKDNIQYDEEILKADLEKVRDFAFTAFNPVISIFMGKQSHDLVRIINMHFPEVTYVLLINQRTGC